MKRILILGGDSDHNLGDAAILSSLCHTWASYRSDVEISVTSADPARMPQLPGVTCVLPRGFDSVATLSKAARAQDLIVVGGGGLFQDDDSRIKMPYWAARLAALKCLNGNIAGHCLGAGPLRHAESRMFARIACSRLTSLSVRDEFARGWLAKCIDRPIDIVPDPAFMLPPAPPEAAEAHLRSLQIPADKPVIGVALRRWFHRLGGFIPHKVRVRAGLDSGDDAMMESFLNDLASALQRISGRLGASILLMPTYNVSHEADAAVCESLASRLPGTTVRLSVMKDPALYKAVAGRLSLMISARMHPMILAAGMGVPIVGIAYNGKFGGVLELLGIPDSFLWLNDFRGGAQADRLEALAARALERQVDLHARATALALQVTGATIALLKA